MASIQGIYVALFGRPADPSGLAYFNSVTNNGSDLTKIGDLASTPEYKDRFSGQSNTQIVNAIYQALFNREAEPAGLSFFVDALNKGTFNIKNIAVAILDGAKGSDQTIVNNKVAAADLFTKSLDTPAEIAAYKGNAAANIGRDFLKTVTTSVPSAAAIDNAITKIGVGTPTTGGGGGSLPTLLGTSFEQKALAALDINTIQDPLFSAQWYLKNDGSRYAGQPPAQKLDVNIAGAWADGYTGKGIKVAINDDGMDLNHADLVANILQNLTYNSATTVTGPHAYDQGNGGYNPANDANEHGTVVGSIVGMKANGVGMVGLAPDASLISGLAISKTANVNVPGLYNYLTNIAKADVSVNSFGKDPAFSENFSSAGSADDQTYLASIEKAGKEGRGGLGTVIEVSAGNEGNAGQNYNLADAAMTGTTNNKYIITVGAVNEYGQKATYSTPGASVLVSAFGGENPADKPQSDNSGFGLVSADISGAVGYNTTAGTAGDYAYQNIGTSYSGPMVGAVAALMLQANPLLGFRDVANILAMTARATATQSSSVTTKGDGVNFGGMVFTRDIGFGLIDVSAAVRLAASWTDAAKTAANWISAEGISANAAIDIPDNNANGTTVTAQLTKNVLIERMEFDLKLDGAKPSQLKAVVTSPQGTTVTLFDQPLSHDVPDPNANPPQPNPLVDTAWPGKFQIGATAFLGEQSAGTWTLKLIDKVTGEVARFEELTVRAWGSEVKSDSHYVLTDAFTGNKTVTDGAGVDLIDAAAVSGNVTIDLNAGQTSTIANGSFTIGAGVQIENAFGGAGADTIIGNDLANILRGNGGADTLTGKGGADVFMFANINESHAGARDTITDFEVGTDKIDLRLLDANLNQTGNQDFLFGGQSGTVIANGVVFNYVNGNTIVSADVNGDTTADFEVALTGQKALTANDFYGLLQAA